MAEHFSLALGFHARRNTHIFVGDDGFCPLDYYLSAYGEGLAYTTFRDFQPGDRLMILVFDLDREQPREWHVPRVQLFFKPALVGGVNDNPTPFQVPAVPDALAEDPEAIGAQRHRTDLPLEKIEGFPIPSKSFGGEFKRFWSTGDHGQAESPWLTFEKAGSYIFGVQLEIFEKPDSPEPTARFVFDPEMHVKTSTGGPGRPGGPSLPPVWP